MAQKKVRAAIVSQEKLAEGSSACGWTRRKAEASRPAQFIAVYSNDPSKLLPRPISICEADKEKGRLRLVYRIAGAPGLWSFPDTRPGIRWTSWVLWETGFR